MDSIIPICNTCRKTERGYCSLTYQKQKPSSVLQNDSPVAHNHRFKMMHFHSKTSILVAQSALKFWSQLHKVCFRWLRDCFETTLSHGSLCFEFFEWVLLPMPFRWLIMLNYDTPHADEFDFDGQTTIFTFCPFQWLRVFRVLFASCQKLSFRWLMNHHHVRPSHQNFLSKRTCVTRFR